MTTRGDPLVKEHVEALNMIELEFRGKKYRTVRTAWRIYLHYLNNYDLSNPNKSIELLANLLVAMSASLGYGELDEVDMQKGWYVPVKYSNDEKARADLHNALILFLANNKDISSNLLKDILINLRKVKENSENPSQNDDISG